MAATIRTRTRWSVLALLVSYLRDGSVDTSKFTTKFGAAGAYPMTSYVWTFTLDGRLYQIRAVDASVKPLGGVTLSFSDDVPDPSQAMPQAYTLTARVSVVVPHSPTGESFARRVAQKVDEALWRAQGKLEIKDYDSWPSASASPQAFVSWQAVPRGRWSSQDDKGFFESLAMDFELRYSIPRSEW